MSTDAGNPFDRGHRALYRRIGTVAGIVLAAAAAIAVWRNPAIADSLGRAARNPDWPRRAWRPRRSPRRSSGS
jgi:hypothetical protein